LGPALKRAHPNPDDVRQRLRAAARERAAADEAKELATANLTRALEESANAGISHSEASRLGGVTRNGAYELLRKAS
jgi:hypothetical protein